MTSPKTTDAVASFTTTIPGLPEGKALGAAIDAAKVQAIKDAFAAGITDPDEMRALILAARDKAKREFYAPKA